MSDIVITAAACVTERLCGSHRAPPRPWDDVRGATGGAGHLPTFPWSALFDRPCPRFGRMDPLVKLGLAAVELMNVDFDARPAGEREATGICLGTPEGSLSVDAEFWRKRDAPGGPNPTLFTYTLPSTLIGEICIRYGLKGPNLCLMLRESDSGRLLRESVEWLRAGEADSVVCVAANAVDDETAAAFAPPGGPPGGRSYAFALHLERGGRAGRSALDAVPDGDATVQAVCTSLCRIPGDA
jgi:3-oxoacyl-(acyl-carrier-protein) synthase